MANNWNSNNSEHLVQDEPCAVAEALDRREVAREHERHALLERQLVRGQARDGDRVEELHVDRRPLGISMMMQSDFSSSSYGCARCGLMCTRKAKAFRLYSSALHPSGKWF